MSDRQFKLTKSTRIAKLWVRSANRAIKVLWRRFHPRPPFSELELQPIRLELLGLDQFEVHAKKLAERHRVGAGQSRDLLLRLADNENILVQSYEELSVAIRNKELISPAGEWLLDNFHLIEEEIRTARRHLPAGYCRELPHLINTANAGFPRVYDIALEVIAHVDGRVDRENITTFVASYQKITPLKLGEFWAIPIMFRLALIENLRRVAARVVVALNDTTKSRQFMAPRKRRLPILEPTDT